MHFNKVLLHNVNCNDIIQNAKVTVLFEKTVVVLMSMTAGYGKKHLHCQMLYGVVALHAS